MHINWLTNDAPVKTPPFTTIESDGERPVYRYTVPVPQLIGYRELVMATYQEEKPVIVLVDNDAYNIDFLFNTLSSEHTVLTASGASDVLNIARTEPPELIIINLAMDDQDGYELCRRLKAISTTEKTPIILLAPTVDSSVEASGFAAGASDFISLPLQAEVVKRRVAMQLELSQCREEREQFRGLDPVTGLANRQRFDAQLGNEWQRGIRNTECLSLLVFGIDDFNAYLEQYGRQAGNKCLEHIAKTIIEEIHRSSDRVARFDDDQIACILPDTDYEGALLLAEKIRKGIDYQHIKHAASTTAGHLTISVGLASMSPTDDARISDLVNAARRYLDESRRDGGNQVQGCLHPPLHPSEEP